MILKYRNIRRQTAPLLIFLFLFKERISSRVDSLSRFIGEGLTRLLPVRTELASLLLLSVSFTLRFVTCHGFIAFVEV